MGQIARDNGYFQFTCFAYILTFIIIVLPRKWVKFTPQAEKIFQENYRGVNLSETYNPLKHFYILLKLQGGELI